MLLIRVTEGRQGFEAGGALVTSVSRDKWEGRQKGGIARAVVVDVARNEEKITIAGARVYDARPSGRTARCYLRDPSTSSSSPSSSVGCRPSPPQQRKNITYKPHISNLATNPCGEGGRIVVKRCFVVPRHFPG